MCVYCHSRCIINHRCNYISGFAANARHFLQVINARRYYIVKIIQQHVGHAHQVFGFVVRVTDASDVIENNIRCSFCQCFGIGKTLKQSRGNHIYPLIGTLCREDHSN
ncbi:hypothetical protein D3C85_1586190 [compost metagenome]